MERRNFLRTGVALGAAGLGGVGLLPEIAAADAPHSSGRGRPGSGTLRLNSNENPLGLAPNARRAVIGNIGEANRYPDEDETALIAALAEKHAVKPDNIVLGNGSTEVLQMAVQAFGGSDAKLIFADPTFEDVPWYAGPFSYRLEKVPLDSRYAHDIGRMKERAEASPGRSLVYICNPNNPTATLTPCSEIDAWIEEAPDDTYFLIDEAYFEYARDPGYWTSIPMIERRPNVIVVRTFSKIYGMAGMRLGYGIAHADTAERVRRLIAKNNANQLALVAALASLSDPELEDHSLTTNAEGLEILIDCLEEVDLEYLPCHTSFVMHRINGDLDRYRERMKENDVLVGRPFPPMLDYNRVSIGLPEEMGQFTDVLRSFRKKGWV